MLNKLTVVCKMDIKMVNELLLRATKGKLCLNTKEEIQKIIQDLEKKSLQYFSYNIFNDEDIYFVRHKFEKFLIENFPGINPKKIYDILLVFTEFSTNMLKHAKGGIFIAYILSNGIYMVFNDSGEGIDIEKIPYIALSNYSTAEGSLGFGFSICIHLCNSIGIATDEKGTSIIAFFEK